MRDLKRKKAAKLILQRNHIYSCLQIIEEIYQAKLAYKGQYKKTTRTTLYS